MAKSISSSQGVEDTIAKWKIHTQVLGFFCHYVSRKAQAEGGVPFRDVLMDAILPIVASATIKASWDTTQATLSDPERWRSDAEGELLSNIDAAELEYGECESLGVSEEELKGFSFLRPETALGKFAANLDEILDRDLEIPASMEVAYATVSGLVDTEVSTLVESIRQNS